MHLDWTGSKRILVNSSKLNWVNWTKPIKKNSSSAHYLLSGRGLVAAVHICYYYLKKKRFLMEAYAWERSITHGDNFCFKTRNKAKMNDHIFGLTWEARI